MIPRVFVIDDDPDLRATILRTLTRDGFDCHDFAAGRQAIEAAQATPPDVALVDLLLEDLPGLVVMTELHAVCRATQCIVITGHGTVASAVASINLGAFAYLVKPFDRQDILSAVRGGISRRNDIDAFRQMRQEFETVLDTVVNMVAVVTPDFHVRHVNARWRTAAGQSADATDIPIQNLVADTSVERLRESLQTTFRQGEHAECIVSLPGIVGYAGVVLRLHPLRDERGLIESILMVSSDATAPFLVSAPVSPTDLLTGLNDPAPSETAATADDGNAPIRMLLVDDDLESGEAARLMLTKRGVAVVLSPNAEHALSLFDPSRFDILVTDIRLPGMDGIGLLRKIRDTMADFPVLLITGYDSMETAIQAVQLSAQDYIVKPFKNIESVLLPAQRAVRSHRLLNMSRRLQRNLRESEARWRALVQSAPNIIAIVDSEGRVRFINRTASGKDPADLLGHAIMDRIKPEHHAAARAALEEVFTNGHEAACEVEVARSGGSPAWYEARLAPIRDGHRTVGATVIATDISRRKREDEALERSHRELRALWSRFTHLDETQRREFARELHDQIGTAVTSLGMNLSYIRGRLPTNTDADLLTRLDDAAQQLERIGECVRDVMGNMRPPVLDDYGLLATLRWYAEKCAHRMGVRIDVSGTETALRCPLEVETAFFRIAQEALMNIAKHARASRAEIQLHYDRTRTRLTLADNGVGFVQETLHAEAPTFHWGLLTMRERAEAIGARFSIDSCPGDGTRVTVEWRPPTTEEHDVFNSPKEPPPQRKDDTHDHRIESHSGND